jgi:acyl-CoA synthetase (AMP-forming)/AMP-acid ligase II
MKEAAGIESWTHPGEIPHRRKPADAAALSDPRLTLDNAAFARAVASIARQLAEQGVGPGDVVATMLPNRLELVLVMFAAWQLRAALTPVNPALTADEAGYQIEDSAARLVIVDNASATVLGGIRAPLIQVESLQLDGAPLEAPHYEMNDVALIIYTSGTTGRPKGVLLDHANIAAMVRMIHAGLELTARDRALLVLPLFHVNAIMVSAVAPLGAGGSTVIRERFERLSFWRTTAEAEATYFSGVPTIFLLLCQLEEEARRATPNLRFVVCGAAPLPAAAIAQFESQYGVPLIEGYGLTESTVGATLNPLHGPRKPGTVGVALPGVEIRILDDANRALPVGEIGEVALRGANVMRGYLGRPEETAQALEGGWLRTGDVGRLDEDGYLTLVDRKKDMLIRGGENIYPKEIENVLHAHPAVHEAAVIGRPHPIFGEEPVAFVSLRPGAHVEPAELIEFARTRLAQYKTPVALWVRPELPKNAVGKISKPALRALLQGD